jgi:hypothetical protein
MSLGLFAEPGGYSAFEFAEALSGGELDLGFGPVHDPAFEALAFSPGFEVLDHPDPELVFQALAPGEELASGPGRSPRSGRGFQPPVPLGMLARDPDGLVMFGSGRRGRTSVGRTSVGRTSEGLRTED